MNENIGNKDKQKVMLSYDSCNKKRYLFTVLIFGFIITVIITFSDLKNMFISNVSTIEMISPFIFLFTILIVVFPKQIGNFLTVGSIFIAGLFFIFSEYSNDKAIKYSIEAVHTYNCEFASSTLPNLSPGAVSYGHFIIDPYIQNLSFIYGKIGPATGDNIKQAIYDMSYYNNLINIITTINTATISDSKDTKKSLITSNSIKQAVDFLNLINEKYCKLKKPVPFKY